MDRQVRTNLPGIEEEDEHERAAGARFQKR